MSQNKFGIGLAVVAIVIAAVALFAAFSPSSPKAGGSTSALWTMEGGSKTGSGGTRINEVTTGTCNAATVELPLEATSTDAFTCSAPGVIAGQQVFISLPSDSGSFQGGFQVSYTVAATDSITFGLMNSTGSATSSFPLATTSVQWYAVQD